MFGAATTSVACCQLAPEVTRPKINERLAREAIGQALANGAQIVVLPELVTSGYEFRSTEEVRSAAIPANGAVLREWATELNGSEAVVIGGFCEKGPDGDIFNSAAVVDATGVLAVYRKTHLWDAEKQWFRPGDMAPPVVTTRHGRIGVAVCYDLEFPEVARGLALQGADLLVLPTNWGHRPEENERWSLMQSLAITTAFVNRIFVVACDRAGAERGVEFGGRSVIADPSGVVLAGALANRGVQTLRADCDLNKARNKATSARNHVFNDRRPTLYRHVFT